MKKHQQPPVESATLGLSRRRAIQGLAAAALPLGSIELAQAAVQGNGNTASWAMGSDPAIDAQAFARRFTTALLNPLSPTALGTISGIYKPDGSSGTTYTIKASQGQQNVLGIPGVSTTIWGYHNSETGPMFPGRSFEVRSGTAITVRWMNNLATAAGTPLPHLLPVDQTITIQSPTTGVPLAVHHHGGDTDYSYDGTPDQWSTPNRRHVGPGIATDNSRGQYPAGQTVVNALYQNQQEASLHWYHDHAESLTRTNVQAGLAGLYVVRDANEDLLCATAVIPSRDYEVALVLQDRTFDASGNLTYSASPVDYPGPIAPNFPANNPTHMPENFGDVICVNGAAWPVMKVEARSYRVRLLNGSDSRFYTLNFGSRTGVYQIGTDLGMMNKGVKLSAVTIAPGERVDLVLDFSAYGGLLPALLQPTVNVDVTNSAPTPFPGGGAPVGGATLVMRFSVSLNFNLLKADPSPWLLPLQNLRPLLPQLAAVPTVPSKVRRVLLAEGVDEYGRITPMLGTYDPTGVANQGTLSLHDPITETPTVGTSEVWEFWNTTVDSHPVHMHLVDFRVLNRQAFNGSVGAKVMSNGWDGVVLQPGAALIGAAVAAPATEQGAKDTVVCPSGQVTRIVVNFKRRGTYVYHCHILSHEEHDMMRFYKVV